MKATLRRDILVETYVDIESLIYDVVWKFVRKYGGDSEELVAEAGLLYILAFDSYREAKGALSTWIHFYIWKGLLNFIKKTRQENRYGIVFGHLHKGGTTEATRSFHLFELLEEVSDDSKFIISLVFTPPEAITEEDLGKGFSACKTRTYLKGYLRNLGWTSRQIKTSFEEIREVLNVKAP